MKNFNCQKCVEFSKCTNQCGWLKTKLKQVEITRNKPEITYSDLQDDDRFQPKQKLSDLQDNKYSATKLKHIIIMMYFIDQQPIGILINQLPCSKVYIYRIINQTKELILNKVSDYQGRDHIQ